MTDEPLILVSNDDGVGQPGIVALAKALGCLGRVVTVAPASEQSAASHSLSIRHPLRAEQLADNVLAVSGTPADCVLIAIRSLLDRHPDVVVSGINDGPNLGDDVNYSGTVAAALEGSLLGVPSIAVSLGREAGRDFDAAAQVAVEVTRHVLANETPFPPENDLVTNGDTPRDGRRRRDRLVLNVNVPGCPADQIGVIRVTRLGKRVYQDPIVEKTDPRGGRYFWVAGQPAWVPETDAIPTDIEVIRQNDVSVTPLQLDATNYEQLDRIEAWGLTSDRSRS